jgi:diguanylate cyclase (GGDEF)-like protein/PAS domain S-box-containing protein
MYGLSFEHQECVAGARPATENEAPSQAGPAGRACTDQDAQQHRMFQLCELAQCVLYVIDTEQKRLTLVSRHALAVLGYEPVALCRMNAEALISLIHPQDYAVAYAQVQRCAAAPPGHTVEIDLRVQRPDGEFRWVRNRITVLSCDAHGRVREFMGSALDITAQRRLPERMAQPNMLDPLTGVGNATSYEVELKNLSGVRTGPVSVLMADVDGLRRVNDTLGHEAGDALLRRTAGVLRDNCRGEDLVARIGGDEFAVVLRNTNEATGRAVAARLRAALAAEAGGPPLRVSFGFATAAISESLSGAVRRAECALYADKVARRRLKEF